MARSNNPRACALPGELSTRSRDLLPDRAFGLPKERKYPLYRMARDGTLIPSGSHASNAKARAQQEYDKGNLSAAKLKQIDRKADKVLKECGVKGKKRNPRRGSGTIKVPFTWESTPDEPDFTTKQVGTAAAEVLEEYGNSSAFREKVTQRLREENPNRLTVTAETEEEAERKARKFGRVLHTERIGRDKFAVSVRSHRRNNPEPMNVGALIGRLKF